MLVPSSDNTWFPSLRVEKQGEKLLGSQVLAHLFPCTAKTCSGSPRQLSFLPQ